MSSDANPAMKAAIARQMTVIRRELKTKLQYFMEEFDLPLEMVASVTMALAFDLLHGLDHPGWDDDDERT